MPDDPTPKTRRIAPKLLWLGALTPLLFGFDFASKQAVVEAIGPREVVPVLDGLLSFVHAENPGAMGSTPIPMPLLIAVGFAILGYLGWMVWRMPDRARLPAVAVSLLLAGALGNQVDRLDGGTVTDFIRVSAEGTAWGPWIAARFGSATWPIFNLADIWLVVGIGMLLVMPARWMEKPKAPAAG
jgi:signal peptidase II